MLVRRVLVVIGCATLATCSLDFDSFTFDNTLPPTTATSTSTSSGMGGQGGVGFDECDIPADCGADADCQTRTCIAGQCGNENAASGTTCDDNGGTFCNGLGACVQCLMNDDCRVGEACEMGTCVPFSCTDLVLNGDETDIDCGGSCLPCDNTKMCMDFSDCVSGFCNNLVCAPCAAIGDCQTGNYCSSMVCTPQKADGQTCTVVDECLSGNCVDGVCCDTACGGLCEGCSMSLSGGTDGTCTPIPLTQDPEMECTAPAYCQGNGTCGTCLYAVPPVGGTCPSICDGGCTNNVCTINCTSSECQGTVTCPPGFACQVNCSGNSSCENSNIFCPADHQCNISCSNTQACRNADLFCSTNGPCAATCSNQSQVCSGFILHCGTNGCSATCNGSPQFPTMQCGASCLCDGC
jgi:hypothetical protein